MVKRLQRIALLLVLIGSVGLSATESAAQDAQSQARAYFTEGVKLAKAQRWSEALNAFERSRALVVRSSTVYNVANALYRLDRGAEALAEIEAHQTMPDVRNDAAKRARGEKLRGLILEAVSHLDLHVQPDDATVHIDGIARQGGGTLRRLTLNPGSHALWIDSAGYEPFRDIVQLQRGHTLGLQVKLERTLKLDNPAEPLDADDGARKPFVKRPGFWILMGSVAAVGVGTALALTLTRKDGASNNCGNTGMCVQF